MEVKYEVKCEWPYFALIQQPKFTKKKGKHVSLVKHIVVWMPVRNVFEKLFNFRIIWMEVALIFSNTVRQLLTTTWHGKESWHNKTDEYKKRLWQPATINRFVVQNEEECPTLCNSKISWLLYSLVLATSVKPWPVIKSWSSLMLFTFNNKLSNVEM